MNNIDKLATVKLQEKHSAVLHNLLLRNPDMTLSEIVALALEPFCRKYSYVKTTRTIQVIVRPHRRGKALV